MAPKAASASDVAQKEGDPSHRLDLTEVLPSSGNPWWKTPHLIKLNLLLTVPMMTGYLIGFDSSMLNGLQSVPVWISGEFDGATVLTKVQRLTLLRQLDFDNPKGARLGVLGTMQTIGAVASLLMVSYIADRFGRRLPVFLGSLLALMGTVLQTLAKNIDTFIAGRFFVGFGTGFVGVASNPLLAELAYPTHRAFITSFASTTWVCRGHDLLMRGAELMSLLFGSSLGQSWRPGVRTARSSCPTAGAGRSRPCFSACPRSTNWSLSTSYRSRRGGS